MFSNIGLDHGQEQIIKNFKHHGGPLPFTHLPDQLLLYLISGPEVTNHLTLFKDLISPNNNDNIYHHEQTKAYQSMFVEHTKLLYSKYKEYGNVLSDKTGSLYNLSTALTLPSSTIDSPVSLESIGKEQYETFVRERLVERTVAIDSPIHSNKLQLMKIIKVAKSKSQELKDLKSLATTLCQLYVTNQVRGGDPTEFFLP